MKVVDGSVQLKWPVTPFGFRVQGSPGVGREGDWVNIDSPVIWGISNVVTIPLEREQEFFRLIK